jgi:hypothetical protein
MRGHQDPKTTARDAILAPTGLCGMAAPRGEIVSARAKCKRGRDFHVELHVRCQH